jgi:UDP-N-acetylglucosamine 4,6-dehydratase/5-epimerase
MKKNSQEKKNYSKFFNGKIFLVTGGTGSFGKAFVRKILKYKVKKIIILSRDELKQFEMRNHFKDNRLDFYIGDIRDYNSIIDAFEKVDYVFHAAALKQVPSSEFFPLEAIKTNTLGTENVINCCNEKGVKNFVLLSTDKAVHPINAMGLSKALAEKIVIAKSRSINEKKLKLSITRYGNVIGSRGSVVPYFKNLIDKKKPITVTDIRMTRFFMHLDDALDLILHALIFGNHGSTYVKKCRTVNIMDLANAMKSHYNSKLSIQKIGLRHGEKLHETLISEEEILRAKQKNNFYEIVRDTKDKNYETFFTKGVKAQKKLNYSSEYEENLTQSEIIRILKKIQYSD